MNHSPEKTTENPEKETGSSEMSKKDLEVAKEDPEVIKKDLEVAEMDSEVTKKDLEAIEENSEMIEKDPEDTKENPVVTKKDSEAIKENSEITPEISDEETESLEEPTEIKEEAKEKSEMTKMGKIILHLVSLLIPIIVLGIAFALHEVYPFGDRQILVTDFWQQYYPFITDFWHRIRGGNSLLWSWTAGGGHDYFAHFAYYLASPFNFLAVLFPHQYLREVLTMFLLIRVGLAGLFMSLFLRFTLKKYDVLLPAFSSFFALSAFTLGYYWNIMWFDTIAIMPLVMLGVYSLVREGKYRLYTISLALAILFNFYIGIFICIFTAITFFTQCFISKLSLHKFMQRLVTIAVCSVVALGIAAVIILPTYSALQNSYRADTVFPDFRFYNYFTSVLGNFIGFTPPTSLDGLPNLYSGVLSIMLIPIFLLSKKIQVRERIIYTIILVFLVISTNINVLNFIWNGFTITNMIPFRFSFLIPFVLVAMSYRAYLLMDELKLEGVLAIALTVSLFHWMATAGEQYSEHVIFSVILSVVYLSLLLSIVISKKKPIFKYALFIVILAELSFSAHGGVYAVRTTYRSQYTYHYDYIQQLLEHRETPEQEFARTEFARWQTLNDPSFYGLNGISFFSSLANVNATYFLVELGLPGWDSGNRFSYTETSPLTDAFLNMRYLLTRYDVLVTDGVYWHYMVSEGNNHLLRNTRYLPFGFMVNEEVAQYVGDRHNPFNSQNDLFRRSTGIDDDLFSIIDIIHVGHRNFDVRRQGLGEYSFTLYEGEYEGTFRFNYEMPEDGFLYAFVRFSDTFPNAYNVRVIHNEDNERHVYNRRPHIFPAGWFEQGELISIETDLNFLYGTGSIFVGYFNQELFDQGIEVLSEETLTITQFSDTSFTGTISVSEPRLLYTSLPYAGNWRVFVNGVEEEIVTIGGAMAGVMLDSGDHTVEFRYQDRSFNLGLIVSVSFLLVYGVLFGLQSKGVDVFESLFKGISSSKSKGEKINYLFFGVLTTLINWIVYSLGVQTLGFSITTSNIIAWIFAIVFAFITNKIWVFNDSDWKPAAILIQVGTFISARIITGLIEIIGVPLLFFAGLTYPVFNIEGFAAKLVVSIIVVVLNYILSKKFVFKSGEPVTGRA